MNEDLLTTIRTALWANQRHVVKAAIVLGQLGSHVSLSELEFGELAVAVLSALESEGYEVIKRVDPSAEGE